MAKFNKPVVDLLVASRLEASFEQGVSSIFLSIFLVLIMNLTPYGSISFVNQRS